MTLTLTSDFTSAISCWTSVERSEEIVATRVPIDGSSGWVNGSGADFTDVTGAVSDMGLPSRLVEPTPQAPVDPSGPEGVGGGQAQRPVETCSSELMPRAAASATWSAVST